MDDHSSECSFVDHGQEAEMGEGLQPQWNVEKMSRRGCDMDEENDMDDVQDTTFLVEVQLQAALQKARVRGERLLRANRRLRGENKGLGRVNASLQECNRLLVQRTSELTGLIMSLGQRHEQTQHAIADMMRQVQEMNTSLQFLINGVMKGGEISSEGS